jgi:[NiFe] hydrogenase assembly HybE family chaperone
MTEAERPSPAAALEQSYRQVQAQQMQGLPMLNPVLHVEAVGFRHWDAHWLGMLVTPWFMNLVLLPRIVTSWQPLAERAKRPYRFPAGVYEFIGARHAALGDYQACSLFSPMFDFANQEGARDTALAVLGALFERPAATLTSPAAAPAIAAPRALSKREWLFGTARKIDRDD